MFRIASRFNGVLDQIRAIKAEKKYLGTSVCDTGAIIRPNDLAIARCWHREPHKWLHEHVDSLFDPMLGEKEHDDFLARSKLSSCASATTEGTLYNSPYLSPAYMSSLFGV